MKKEKINQPDWQDRLQTFTSGNAGRKAAIATGGMTLVENKPFESVVYDQIQKGNDLVLAVDGFIHLVNAPVEIYMEKQDNGIVSTLEVIDQNNNSTYLRLI